MFKFIVSGLYSVACILRHIMAETQVSPCIDNNVQGTEGTGMCRG